MKFSRQIDCHFDQCDPAGILFYGQAFTIGHQTIESFLQHIGIPWKDWFDHSDWAVPVRHAEADFTQKLRAGEKIKAILQVFKSKKTSVGFLVTLVNEEGNTCVAVKTVHVFVDRQSGEKTPIPKDFAHRISRYLVD